jgi:hypothetical protein
MRFHLRPAGKPVLARERVLRVGELRGRIGPAQIIETILGFRSSGIQDWDAPAGLETLLLLYPVSASTGEG